MRLGMLLEVATAAGSLLGGVTAQLLAQSTLQTVVRRRDGDRRGHHADARCSAATSSSIRPSIRVCWAAAITKRKAAATVTYRVKRLPLALVASFVAGNVSSLLGIGGGIIKVPVLNAWCGVPLRAAAATSAFMIGVTATAGAMIYYGHGQLVPALAAAAVLGVQVGSWGGHAVRRSARRRSGSSC